jgi:hypothetical protein
MKPGVDVMVTIFGYFFANFRPKYWRFSQKTMLCMYDQIFAKTSISLSSKHQYFCYFFGENIFKIITSVPYENVVGTWFRGFEPMSFFFSRDSCDATEPRRQVR